MKNGELYRFQADTSYTIDLTELPYSARGETRTHKGNPNGFWDRNVYQFRHPGRAFSQKDCENNVLSEIQNQLNLMQYKTALAEGRQGRRVLIKEF